MGFRTVVIESQSRCSYKGGYLVVRKEDTTMIHLSEISCIIFDTTAVFASAYLLVELAKQKIPLVICDEKHNPVGEYLPLYGSHNTSKRIGEQVEWGEVVKKRLWQHIVKDKIYQQARLLEDRGFVESAKILYEYMAGVRSGDTTNREAHAAKVYFNALFSKDFSRGDNSATNACLDYGYAIVLSLINREIVAKGYLTQRGIFHCNEYNQFNFSCDLMEPFRPLVDRLVADSLEVEFTQDMRRTLSDIMSRNMLYREGKYKLSSVIGLYVQDCINVLEKRIAVEEIAPFEWG